MCKTSVTLESVRIKRVYGGSPPSQLRTVVSHWVALEGVWIERDALAAKTIGGRKRARKAWKTRHIPRASREDGMSSKRQNVSDLPNIRG